jgi:hypothetical protein
MDLNLMQVNRSLVAQNNLLVKTVAASQESLESVLDYHRTLHIVLAARQKVEGVLNFPRISNYEELAQLYNQGKLMSSLGGGKLEILDQDFKLFTGVNLA